MTVASPNISDISDISEIFISEGPHAAPAMDMAYDRCCDGGEGQPSDDGRRFFVEAVATMDERGQMVLPKVIRERAGLRAGDRLAISVMEREGRVCCLTLIKAEELAEMVRDTLGPVIKDIL